MHDSTLRQRDTLNCLLSSGGGILTPAMWAYSTVKMAIVEGGVGRGVITRVVCWVGVPAVRAHHVQPGLVGVAPRARRHLKPRFKHQKRRQSAPNVAHRDPDRAIRHCSNDVGWTHDENKVKNDVKVAVPEPRLHARRVGREGRQDRGRPLRPPPNLCMGTRTA